MYFTDKCPKCGGVASLVIQHNKESYVICHNCGLRTDTHTTGNADNAVIDWLLHFYKE